MPCNGTKFLGAITAFGWSFTLDTDPTGGSPETVTIADGTYYLLGDGEADDLLFELEQKIDDAIIALGEVDNLTISISDAGIVSMATTGDYTITWTSTGTVLRDVLRYSGTTLSLSSAPSLGSRAAQYFAHSDVPTRVDRPTDIGRISRTESDDGAVTGNDLGPDIDQYRVAVRYTGPHRSSTPTGYDEFKDLWLLVIKKTKLMRWYPDATDGAPYARFTRPFGYHVVKELEMKAFTPAEVIQDSYSWYVTTMLLQVQP